MKGLGVLAQGGPRGGDTLPPPPDIYIYIYSGTINVAIRKTGSYEPRDHASTVAMSS